MLALQQQESQCQPGTGGHRVAFHAAYVQACQKGRQQGTATVDAPIEEGGREGDGSAHANRGNGAERNEGLPVLQTQAEEDPCQPQSPGEGSNDHAGKQAGRPKGPAIEPAGVGGQDQPEADRHVDRTTGGRGTWLLPALPTPVGNRRETAPPRPPAKPPPHHRTAVVLRDPAASKAFPARSTP